MKNLKSVKQTTKTFTMVFEYCNVYELRQLKSLAILLGDFNQMRNQMRDSNSILEILNKQEETCEFKNIVSSISEHLL